MDQAFSVHFNFKKRLKTKEFEEKKKIEKFSFGFRKLENLEEMSKWTRLFLFEIEKIQKKFRKNVEKMLQKIRYLIVRFQFE